MAHGIVDDADVELTLIAAAEMVFFCTPLCAIVPTVVPLLPSVYTGICFYRCRLA